MTRLRLPVGTCKLERLAAIFKRLVLKCGGV
jgi:hypothetical protein